MFILQRYCWSQCDDWLKRVLSVINVVLLQPLHILIASCKVQECRCGYDF